MKKTLGLAGLALVLALAAVALLWTGAAPNGGQTALAPFAAEAQTAPENLPAVPEMTMGNPEAKVTLIEYASFTCPHCANFHERAFKDLKRDYIDTGRVHFIYREVFFDRYGLWAAMVARCGGQMRFFGIADMLYQQQREWAASDDANAVVANLRRIGRTAGLEDTALDACLNDGAMAQAMVATYQKNATADAVEGTPTLILNGTKHGNMDYPALKALIEAELAK